MSHIYILSNDGMPGLVKIGMTSNTPLDRAKELFTTGVPCGFNIEASWQLPQRYMRDAETELHELLSDYRFNNKREFFTVEPDEAVAFVESYMRERGFGNDLVTGFTDLFLMICTVVSIVLVAMVLVST